MPDKEQVLQALRSVKYPGFSRDIVTFGLVKEVRADQNSVFVRIEFASQTGNVKEQLEPEVREALKTLGVEHIELQIDEKTVGAAKAQMKVEQEQQIEKILNHVKYTIAVASGKGGVGKSTVSVNLACALHKLGKKVGILDADIYGPNIPMMLGLEGKRPKVVGNRVLPLERDGIQVMSLGFLAPSDTAIIWRGPLVGRAIEQMLRDVAWGELDFFIIDLPPGTGDAQLTLTQRLELTGAVMVSTPQSVALSDALKGLRMFQKVNVPVLGIIENMSSFICDECGKEHDIFGKGGVKKAAKKEGVPFLGEIPLTPEMRRAGDSGKPVVLHQADSPATRAFMDIARQIIEQVPAETQAAPKHFKL